MVMQDPHFEGTALKQQYIEEPYSSTVQPKLKGRLMNSCQSRALLSPTLQASLWPLNHGRARRIPWQTSGNWIFVLRSESTNPFISVGSSFSVRHLFFQRPSFHGRFSYIVSDEKWQNSCSAFTVLRLRCLWTSCWKGCVKHKHSNIQITAFLIERGKMFWGHSLSKRLFWFRQPYISLSITCKF